MDLQDHVTRSISYGGFGVSVTVVEELIKGTIRGFSCLGLLCCNGSYCHEHGSIHSSSIVKECAGNLLDTFDARRGEEWRVLSWCGKLLLGPIDDGCRFVRCMLGLPGGVDICEVSPGCILAWTIQRCVCRSPIGLQSHSRVPPPNPW